MDERPAILGTVAELAQRVGGRVAGDGGFRIARIAAIDEATNDALTFATNASYLTAAIKSRAGAVLADEALETAAETSGKPLIFVPSARLALATLLKAFERPRKRGPFRHPSAVVAGDAVIGADVYIGPNALVEARARIGDRCVLEAGTYVGEGAAIGDDSHMLPQAKVMHGCVVGKRVILHPGAVIGADGFGYVFIDGKYEHIPQVGNAVLEDDVEIGVYTCVDRAQTGSTFIGRGTKIDNLCQIGHNCRIGSHVAIAAQCGLAGSTIIGDYVQVGGQAGFTGHLRVGSRVKIGGRSEVWGNVPDDSNVSGAPARPHSERLRREVMIANLPKLVARVTALEKRNRS